MARLKPLDQQSVVLVGASSGVGRDAALRFAGRGARVVVAGQDEEALRSLVEEIRRERREATALRTDVTDFAQLQALADTAIEQYGRIDTWVQLARSSSPQASSRRRLKSSAASLKSTWSALSTARRRPFHTFGMKAER